MHEIEILNLQMWLKGAFTQGIKEAVKQAIKESHAEIEVQKPKGKSEKPKSK